MITCPWMAFILSSKAHPPLPTMNLDGLSCHRLQKLKKRFRQEEQMWRYLSGTSRAHFRMIRVPNESRVPSWMPGLNGHPPTWSPGLDRWIANVQIIHRSVKDKVYEKIHELTKALEVEDVVFGLCHLQGFEQAQRHLLRRRGMLNDTDSESSLEIRSESELTISCSDESVSSDSDL